MLNLTEKISLKLVTIFTCLQALQLIIKLTTMKYLSTRDLHKNPYTFPEILLKGLADDGGLFCPEIYPVLSDAELDAFKRMSYKELAFSIISRFVGNAIPEADLKNIVDSTYTPELFQSEKVTPIEKLTETVYLQDLSTGPSLAFKDVPMQFLGKIIEYELNRQGRSLTIVGASSGDTVSAAEEAFRGKSNINVVMLTPKEGMSPFQKAQAGSILDENIYNLSIDGDFDHCQDLVKKINEDIAFKQDHNIGAVNSINWGRITAQIVYYIYGYLQVAEKVGDLIDVVVPSGNFGNALAGYIAKKMGVPIRHICVATNENNVLEHFFETGVYEQTQCKQTNSPSMDISKASNLERLMYDLCDQNPEALLEAMTTFEATGTVDLSSKLSALKELGFKGHQSTDQDRINTIKQVYKKTKRLIDPHTAAGVQAALKHASRSNDSTPIICMETAKPTKFESAIEKAVGFIPERPEPFKGLEKKEQCFYLEAQTADQIKDFIKEKVKR